MENAQGQLADALLHAIATDCSSVTITDENVYSATDYPVGAGRKLFYVRKGTSSLMPTFESGADGYDLTNYHIPKDKYKDGWNFAFILAAPVIRPGELVESYQIGDLIFYRDIGNGFEGFFIAAKNMGLSGECPVEAPNNLNGTCGCNHSTGINAAWKIPTFEDFYKYIEFIKQGCDCATAMRYGYAESFDVCHSKVLRNKLFIQAGCPCECDYANVLQEPNKADLYLESILIHKQNKRYGDGQKIVEELEKMAKLVK